MPSLSSSASSLPMHQRRSTSLGHSNSNNNSKSKGSNGNHNNNSNNNNTMYGGRGYSDLEGGRGGGGGGGSGGMARGRGRSNNSNNLSSRDANASILEQQNNERIHELSEHVARLKGLTIDIGNEVREQNSLLDGMNDGFQNTRDMLANSLSRIGTMLQSGGAKHMCTLVGFSVFVMCFLWWLMKRSG